MLSLKSLRGKVKSKTIGLFAFIFMHSFFIARSQNSSDSLEYKNINELRIYYNSHKELFYPISIEKMRIGMESPNLFKENFLLPFAFHCGDNTYVDPNNYNYQNIPYTYTKDRKLKNISASIECPSCVIMKIGYSNGVAGLYDYDKSEWFWPLKYKDLSCANDNCTLFIAKTDKGYGIIDWNEEEIVPFMYKEITRYDESVFLFELFNKKQGLYDIKKGKFVLEPNYSSIFEKEVLGELMVVVRRADSRSNYYSFKSGWVFERWKLWAEIVGENNIPIQFDDIDMSMFNVVADDFEIGKSKFKLEGKPIDLLSGYGLLFKQDNGKYTIHNFDDLSQILPIQYDSIYSINGIFVGVMLGNKYGMILSKGNGDFKFSDVVYDSLIYREKGTLVQKEGKWGLINSLLDEVISCNFDKIEQSSEVPGIYYCYKNGDIYLYSEIGELLNKAPYKSIENVYMSPDEKNKSGFKLKKYLNSNEKYGLLTHNYLFMEDAIFDVIISGIGNKLIVGVHGVYGIYDVSTFSYVVEPNFNSISMIGTEFILKKGNLLYTLKDGALVNSNRDIQNVQSNYLKSHGDHKSEKFNDIASLVSIKNDKSGMFFLTKGDKVLTDYNCIRTYNKEGLNNDQIMIVDNGLHGVFDVQKEKWIIKPVYTNLYFIGQKRFVATLNERDGVIDIDGNVILPYQYKSISAFDNNENKLHVVSTDGKSGILDKFSLALDVSCSYDYVENIYGINYWKLTNSGKHTLVDSTYKKISNDEFEDINQIYGKNHFIVKRKGRYFIIDQNGNYPVPSGFYDMTTSNDNSLVIVQGFSRKYGVFDLSGKNLLALDYDMIDNLNDSVYVVRNDQKHGLIVLSNGKVDFVTPIDYDKIEYDNNFYVMIKDNMYGFITDDFLQKDLTCTFDYISPSSCSQALLRIVKDGERKVLLYDKATKALTSYSSTFENYTYSWKSAAFRDTNDNCYVLDENCELLEFKNEFDDIVLLENNLLQVKKNGKYGIFDATKNKLLYKPIFDMISSLGITHNLCGIIDDKLYFLDTSKYRMKWLCDLKYK